MRGIAIGITLLFLTMGSGNSQIVNIEGSETLARALAIEPTRDKGKPENRLEAIRLYNQYLEEHPDTFNKPMVLSQIGLLYLYSTDEENGIPRDISTANQYLKRAIASDPKLVTRPMVSARTNLACAPAPGLPRMRARMDVYEWMMSLTHEDLKNSIQSTGSARAWAGQYRRK